MPRARNAWMPLLAIALAVFAMAATAAAAPTPAWLKALRKAHYYHVYVLRGFPSGDNLRYRADGSLINGGPPLPWTESEFQVRSLRLRRGVLYLGGIRCVYVFDRKQPYRKPRAIGYASLHLAVAMPGAGLDASRADILWWRLFYRDDNDLERAVPAYWEPFFRHQAVPCKLPRQLLFYRLPGDEPCTKSWAVDKSSVPPRAILQPDPAYTLEARQARVGGRLILSIVVGKDGRAHETMIAQPLGAGLDEAAIAAVATWTFEPARKAGKPVAAHADVVVNYEMY